MIAILLFALVNRVSGAAANGNERETVGIPDVSESLLKLQDISRFAAFVRGAETVAVLEGLPHPVLDKMLYEHESKRSDLVWIQGHPFYPRPLNISAEDMGQIQKIILLPSAHLEFPEIYPPPLCGGYHPDYAVLWSKDKTQSGSLICLACWEWKNFTPGELVYGKISADACRELSEILQRYRGPRPDNFTVHFNRVLPPSGEMLDLQRAIKASGILNRLEQLERVSLADTTSAAMEIAVISPPMTVMQDHPSQENSLNAASASASVPDESDIVIVRQIDGDRYWIIRNIGSIGSETFLGPPLHATRSE